MSVAVKSPIVEEPAEIIGNAPATILEASFGTAEVAPLEWPASVTSQVVWPYAVAFAAIHLAACLAFVPWLFSWFGLALLLVMHYLCATIGTSVCYHRMLAHRSFKSPKWLEYLFTTFAVCSLQDSPVRWVAIHRRHHHHTDAQDDPHSPLVSFMWGHFEWLLRRNEAIYTAGFYDKYARDLLRDPFYFFLERNMMWFWVYVAHAVLIFLLGFGVGCLWTYDGLDAVASGLRLGASSLVWGVAVRTLYGWHSTWAVNSVGHLWGYRNYETDDNSRNQALLGILASGEGWHNNHHADPRCARIGHRWWEIDFGWWTIALLERVGLAAEVVAEPRTKEPAEKIVPADS